MHSLARRVEIRCTLPARLGPAKRACAGACNRCPNPHGIYTCCPMHFPHKFASFLGLLGPAPGSRAAVRLAATCGPVQLRSQSAGQVEFFHVNGATASVLPAWSLRAAGKRTTELWNCFRFRASGRSLCAWVVVRRWSGKDPPGEGSFHVREVRGGARGGGALSWAGAGDGHACGRALGQPGQLGLGACLGSWAAGRPARSGPSARVRWPWPPTAAAAGNPALSWPGNQLRIRTRTRYDRLESFEPSILLLNSPDTRLQPTTELDRSTLTGGLLALPPPA